MPARIYSSPTVSPERRRGGMKFGEERSRTGVQEAVDGEYGLEPRRRSHPGRRTAARRFPDPRPGSGRRDRLRAAAAVAAFLLDKRCTGRPARPAAGHVDGGRVPHGAARFPRPGRVAGLCEHPAALRSLLPDGHGRDVVRYSLGVHPTRCSAPRETGEGKRTTVRCRDRLQPAGCSATGWLSLCRSGLRTLLPGCRVLCRRRGARAVHARQVQGRTPGRNTANHNARRDLRGPPVAVGEQTIAYPGGVAGSLLAEHLVGWLGAGTTMRMGLLIEAVTAGVIALSREPLVVGAMLALFGFHAIVWNVITISLRQQIIPEHLLGRVNSVYRLLGLGGMSVGALLGGVLARGFGLTAPFWFSSLSVAILAVVVWGILDNETVRLAREGREG